MNAIKYEVNKLINKEKDLMKYLNDGDLASDSAKAFIDGRVGAFEEVLKIIKDNK